MNMMRPIVAFFFGQKLVFPVTRQPISYVVLGMKYPEDDIAVLRFIGHGYYEGIDGVSYPCTATPSPIACISAPANRDFHVLFLPALKIPSTLIEKTPAGVLSQYYPNCIKIDEVSFNLYKPPQRIHATDEFTEEECEGAFGDNSEGGYMYNCPWGSFYVDRPDLVRGTIVDVDLVFPCF